MGTIAEKLNYLGDTKTAIKDAIVAKGVQIADDTPFRNYADKIGEISGGGEPVEKTKFGATIDNVLGNVDGNGVYSRPTEPFVFDGSGIKEIGDSGMYFAFRGNKITSVDLSSLTAVGDSGLYYTFANNQITSVDLSSLTTVGSSGLQNAFANNQITSVDLSSLTTVGSSGLYYTFYNNQITGCLDLSSLTTVGGYGLYHAFAYNQTLTDIYFRALKSDSFGIYTNQFNSMLYGVAGCTVHFPSNLESVIGSWSDVTKGFGGKNTVVLFDLPATE